jgi:hypothetical protein
VPEYLGHTHAANYSVRLFRLPIDLEPIDVALTHSPSVPQTRAALARRLLRRTLTHVESPLSAQPQA